MAGFVRLFNGLEILVSETLVTGGAATNISERRNGRFPGLSGFPVVTSGPVRPEDFAQRTGIPERPWRSNAADATQEGKGLLVRGRSPLDQAAIRWRIWPGVRIPAEVGHPFRRGRTASARSRHRARRIRACSWSVVRGWTRAEPLV